MIGHGLYRLETVHASQQSLTSIVFDKWCGFLGISTQPAMQRLRVVVLAGGLPPRHRFPRAGNDAVYQGTLVDPDLKDLVEREPPVGQEFVQADCLTNGSRKAI